MKRNEGGIKAGHGRKVLEATFDLQFILKFQNATALWQGPQLGPLILLFRQIIQQTETGSCEHLIGLGAEDCSRQTDNLI